jgi:RHS repeat-associated protein
VNLSNELSYTPNVTYTYDSNGNTLTKTDSTGTTNYVWDFENRLTSVTLPGSGGTVTFKYDSMGRRIYKSSSIATSVYAYDGNNLVEETDSSGAVAARYFQNLRIDEPLAMLRSGATSYYHADALGSVTSLSSVTGSISNTYTYDSFGRLTNTAGSLLNSFRHDGREFDSETNLYYYRARYYDPTSGRFLSEDPITFGGGINFYEYVNDNPANLRDQFGLCVIYIFFEPPGKDPGLFKHAFMVMFDNTQFGSRATEFRGGPDPVDGNRLDSTNHGIVGGGTRAPIDDPKDATDSLTLLANDCPCGPYRNKLNDLNKFVNSNYIPYDKKAEKGWNSNSLVSAGISSLGLPLPTLPFSPWRAPGWGKPLPGWPPPPANAK